MGDLEWTKLYGGPEADENAHVIQTNDHGFALAAYTRSFGTGVGDLLLIKVNSEGAVEWARTYGGTNDEGRCRVVQTHDGGYALAGYTRSFGDTSNGILLVRTDPAGELLWSRVFGGEYADGPQKIIETGDSGLAIAGYTYNWGAGSNDYFLVKTSASGDFQWARTYGSSVGEGANSVIQTSDGGFALAGNSPAYGAGGHDILVVKTDATGVPVWARAYGFSLNETGSSIVETADGGFAVGGYTVSVGAGAQDFLLIKTGATGAPSWARLFGAAGQDLCYRFVGTGDDGFAMVGTTTSYGAGGQDAMLVKTGPSGNVDGCSTPAQVQTASVTVTTTSPVTGQVVSPTQMSCSVPERAVSLVQTVRCRHVAAAIQDVATAAPRVGAIRFAAPNPSTLSLKIGYDVDQPGAVQFDILDLSGRVVASLAPREMQAGTLTAKFVRLR